MLSEKKKNYHCHLKSDQQLCWNCARCTNKKGFECPWVKNGKPVEGWTATEGNAHYVYISKNGKTYDLGNSYKITQCPLYIQERKFTTRAEAINVIADTLKLKPYTIRSAISKSGYYFDRYEEITGEKLPYWLTHYEQDKKFFGKEE